MGHYKHVCVRFGIPFVDAGNVVSYARGSDEEVYAGLEPGGLEPAHDVPGRLYAAGAAHAASAQKGMAQILNVFLHSGVCGKGAEDQEHQREKYFQG